MNLAEAKKHLGKMVKRGDAEYLLRGLIIRINSKSEYVYIAELLDKSANSILQCNVELISEAVDIPDVRDTLMKSSLMQNPL